MLSVNRADALSHDGNDFDFPELDPVKLLKLTNLKRADLADWLGVEKHTLDCWCCGVRNPNKQVRRLAAELYRRWSAEGRFLIANGKEGIA